ncbi:hypothetical protein K3888_11170 [Dietzia aurantiaca]|uniref:hypothetical protein n=1 Tax=Dietzia aurantiaca TaxID=983873 RepID=UPI001E5E3D2A|nr:hypothetical protein [Dietzia aurantiaca]MCD2263258.1 hypothetical protein [Dietzia aurantiaca]
MRLISKDALGAYMEARDLSNRTLAIKAGSESYRSTIGHLRSGKRNSCGPKIAGAIEKALGAPPGSLFLVEMANANVANRQKAAA